MNKTEALIEELKLKERFLPSFNITEKTFVTMVAGSQRKDTGLLPKGKKKKLAKSMYDACIQLKKDNHLTDKEYCWQCWVFVCVWMYQEKCSKQKRDKSKQSIGLTSQLINCHRLIAKLDKVFMNVPIVREAAEMTELIGISAPNPPQI